MRVHLENDSSTCRIFNYRLNSEVLCDGKTRHPLVDLWLWEIFLLWFLPIFVEKMSCFLSRRLTKRYCLASYKEWELEKARKQEEPDDEDE